MSFSSLLFPSSSSNMDNMRNPSPPAKIEDQTRNLRQTSGIQVSNPNVNLNIAHKLYDDFTSKDFKILVGDHEFRLHKCFLTMGSPQLAALIGAEDNSGVLSIVDFSPKLIEEFIRFLYKNEISEESVKDPKILAELIRFGDKYQMDYLVDYSIKLVEVHKHLFDKISRRNFFKMATATVQCDKILDSIIEIFKTESSTTTDQTSSQNQNQNRPTTSSQFGVPQYTGFYLGNPNLGLFGSTTPAISTFGNFIQNRPNTSPQENQFGVQQSTGITSFGSTFPSARSSGFGSTSAFFEPTTPSRGFESNKNCSTPPYGGFGSTSASSGSYSLLSAPKSVFGNQSPSSSAGSLFGTNPK